MAKINDQMKLRISLILTLLLISFLHYLTPVWLLGDFNVLCDWLMIGAFLFNILLTFVGKVSINPKYYLCTIISSIVFISITTYSTDEDEGPFSFRMFRVFDFGEIVSSRIAEIADLINLVSLLVLLITELIIAAMVIKFILIKNNSEIKL